MSWILCTAFIALAAGPFSSPRAKESRARVEASLRSSVENLGVAFPPRKLFLRAFKHERELEIWIGSRTGPMELLHTYPILASSGEPGPKRREGDRQVPEGAYVINRFNPNSSYFLSLGINYPNASDAILSDKLKPGGDIFIHGQNKSIGCLALGDDAIAYVYTLCGMTTERWSTKIPVHLFPFRMQAPLTKEFSASFPQHAEFWKSLREVYAAFEATKLVPGTGVNAKGMYRIR